MSFQIIKPGLKEPCKPGLEDGTTDNLEIYTFSKPDGPTVKLLHRASRAGFKGGALQKALENTDGRAEYVCIFDADFVPYPDTIEQFVKTFQVLAPIEPINADPSTLRLYSGPLASLRTGYTDSAKSADLDNKPGLEGIYLPAGRQGKPGLSGSNIAAVQGYQWHVLNKSQTWVTRGVRTEYAGSYVVERSGEEIYGGLKQIAGSVYAIRADILRQFGWGTSITEDFELTLRLYEAGYKVAFTPYIQVPAEAVSTIKRLIRQRMRWAEGASFNVKIMLSRMLFGRWESASANSSTPGESEPTPGVFLGGENQQFNSETMPYKPGLENLREEEASDGNKPGLGELQTGFGGGAGKVWVSSKLTLAEKLEFLYLAPYYLQAAFFVIGTFSWFISEAVFGSRLPFWTAAFGWSLVFTNLLALPLMNLVGLFLEESDERDYVGIISFVALSYIVVPFQAYAAIKGFLEKEEGPWFRTPKTGTITDTFGRATFSKFFGNILGRPATIHANDMRMEMVRMDANKQSLRSSSATAGPERTLAHSFRLAEIRINSRIPIKPRHIKWVGNLAMGVIIAVTVAMSIFAPLIPQAKLDVSADQRQFAMLSNDVADDDTVSSVSSGVGTSQEITDPVLVQFAAGGGKNLEYIFHPEPRVRTKFGGREIEMILDSAEGLGKSNPKKSIKEDGVFIYQNVWENIDLHLIPQKGKLTEEIILSEYRDLNSFNYDLKLTGLEPALFEEEIVLASNAGGPGLFSFTKPYMYEQDHPEEKNFGISYTLAKKAIGWELEKELSPEGKEWLADPDRAFPVVIDPTQVTLVIQGSLNATETQFSSVQRKIAYSARGAETDAWYAVYEEASGADVFWTRCLVPCDGSTNTWGTDTEMDDEASDDDESPTLWMEGTDLYAAWFDNASDGPKWRSWETAAEPETANQNACQADDVGTVGAGLVSIAVADDGDVYTAQITDGQASTEITISKSTSACSNSDLSSDGTAGGLTQSDAHAMVTIGDNLLLIYNDGDLSASSYVDDASPAWDQTNVDINGGAAANAEEDFSVTTDGTDVWVLQAISTTDTELWKCAACNLSSQSWSSQTAPFTGFTNGSDVSISYISGSNVLVAMSLQGSGTGEQVHWKTSTDEGANWSADNTYGFSAGASGLDRLSSTLTGANDEQIAATVLETTNSEWEFSTLPEKTLYLFILTPFLGYLFGKFRRRKR